MSQSKVDIFKHPREALLSYLEEVHKKYKGNPECENSIEALEKTIEQVRSQVKESEEKTAKKFPRSFIVIALLLLNVSCASHVVAKKAIGPLGCAQIAASWGICCETTMHPTDEPRK